MKELQINDQLIKFFQSNYLTQIMAGTCINYPQGCRAFTDGESYALLVSENGTVTDCYLYTQNLAFVDEVCQSLHGEVSFNGVTEQIYTYLRSKYTETYFTACNLYVWDGTPLTRQAQGDLRKVDSSMAQMVSDGTFYHASVEGICEAIAKRPSSALFVDGKPVCWCILHEDNSLGMLYTLPEYRKKGYALEVMTHLVHQVIDSGIMPFCYIVNGNTASESLALKYNMKYVCDASYVTVILP